jgi:uncharacterized membrane protein
MEMLAQLLGPLHPPLVHFAVACPILAFFAVLGRCFWNKPWFSYSAASLWILTFLSALAAVVSGHLFSLHLGMVSQWTFLPPETAVKGHLRDHALLGTLSAFSSFLTLWAAIRIIQQKPWPMGLQLFLGFILAVLFGLTGHEGGEMVYASPDNSTLTVSSSFAPPVSDLLQRVQGNRQDLVKMNSKTWNSRTHGHRWVNTYVSKQAVAAYKNSTPLPEGSYVVKESFENDSEGTPGPLYVMLKGKVSDSPETGGWQYAMEWEKPVPSNPEKIQMPVKWLPGDPHLNSCVRCHNHFRATDHLGGIPDGFENP